MDTSKIIIGTVGGGRYTVTAPIVKEDYGLYLKIEGLELPETYQVDFSNSEHNGTSVTMIGNSNGVLIPSQFISSGKDVFAFLYHVGVDFGRTVYKFRIPNKLRPDRTDEEPTPEEQSIIDQAIAALNDAVEQTAQDVASAHGYAQASASNAESASASAQSADASREAADESEYNAQVYAENAQVSATASAQSASQSAQIKDDVESMVDDAQGYATASAQSASASANSASQASGYAQSASASAQSASGYASQAQTSAQTASSKATEASGYASTASNKASEASQSASQALSYKTDAESAKTASQTAQGLAESARDSAQGYAEDAQGYAEDAQASAESISASASQIAQNTSDIASLEEDRYKPYVTDSASGSIASFPDGADDLPLKSLVVDIDPVQDLSNGDPSPENICPISGWTEVNVEQSGVNVWDEEWVKGEISRNGELISDNTHLASKNFISVVPSSAYCLVGARAQVAAYDLGKTFLGFINSGYIGTNGSNVVFNTTENTHFIRFNCAATYGTTYNHDISINYPSTDHSYHPYTGRSITISLGQTVYGGKLDVLSGVMRVEKYYGDLSGASIYVQNDEYKLVQKFGFPHAKNISGGAAISNVTNKFGNIPSSSYNSTRIQFSITGTERVFASLPIDFDVSIVTFCYDLAEPIEIQLTPHEVNSLLGQNNIFADTGDTSAEYRADTRLYIEKLTQPTEDDMVANSAITSGQFFMIGNSLYRALANIASGATITVGTNAQRVSLADALNLINT